LVVVWSVVVSYALFARVGRLYGVVCVVVVLAALWFLFFLPPPPSQFVLVFVVVVVALSRGVFWHRSDACVAFVSVVHFLFASLGWPAGIVHGIVVFCSFRSPLLPQFVSTSPPATFWFMVAGALGLVLLPNLLVCLSVSVSFPFGLWASCTLCLFLLLFVHSISSFSVFSCCLRNLQPVLPLPFPLCPLYRFDNCLACGHCALRAFFVVPPSIFPVLPGHVNRLCVSCPRYRFYFRSSRMSTSVCCSTVWPAGIVHLSCFCFVCPITFQFYFVSAFFAKSAPLSP
jgi:hypothetical protein